VINMDRDRFGNPDFANFQAKPSRQFDVEIGLGGKVRIVGEKMPKIKPGQQMMRQGMSRKESRDARSR
jgi:hypothetical protein